MFKEQETISHASSANSHRKTLIERLASLRIQSNDPSDSSDKKASESPRYIPRNTQITTKSKFYPNESSSSAASLPSSPTIGRRRKLANYSAISSSISPIGTCSPKCFPKQLIFNDSTVKSPVFSEIIDNNQKPSRKHCASDVVASFIGSLAFLNNFLAETENSKEANVQLEIMNSSFVALQQDLKAAVSSIKASNSEISHITPDLKEKQLEEDLKSLQNQLTDMRSSLDKEKANVEFLQNYMEEIIQLKDEGEKRISELETKNAELESLKEAKDPQKEPEELTRIRENLEQKIIEIEKLKSRENHFKESNEIFQQKLQILTEENRKLRGQRPLNSL